MSLWKRYNTNPLDNLKNLKNKLQLCYESNALAISAPILDSLPSIFREIYSFDDMNSGVLFSVLQNPEIDSSNDANQIKKNQQECEELLYSILSMQNQSLGLLMYETSQKYQREYYVPIYLLPRIFVDKILQKIPLQGDSVMENYASTLRYGININHENQIKLSQDEYLLVTFFNAFIFINRKRDFYTQKVMHNQNDLLNRILNSYLDYFKNSFKSGVYYNINNNSFYKKFRVLFDDFMVNNAFQQSHGMNDSIQQNFPQEHMLRAMSNYLDFQHGILFEEFVQSKKSFQGNKMLQKSPSMYNLSMLFFNYAFSVLSNWPADNKIPILRFVEVWTKFMSPLNIPEIILKESDKKNQVNTHAMNPDIASNLYLDKLSKKVSQTEFLTIVNEFFLAYVSNSIHCYNYLFSLFVIKISEMYQYQYAIEDFESIIYVLNLFKPVDLPNTYEKAIFKGVIKSSFIKESSATFQDRGEYYMKMESEYFDYRNCRIVKNKVHKLISVLNTVASSLVAEKIKTDLRQQFDINDKTTGKIDESLFSRTDNRINHRPSIKKLDYPFAFEGTWEEPIDASELFITYFIALKLCDGIDKVLYDYLDLKKPIKKIQTKRMMLQDDKWVPYKNEYMINREPPMTNLRLLAKRNLFYCIVVIQAFYYLMF